MNKCKNNVKSSINVAAKAIATPKCEEAQGRVLEYISELEELAEFGDAASMSKLAYWYLDRDISRTIDLIAHAAMRLSPVAMTIIARSMLALSQPGRNHRGKYWSWGIAIMSQASAANIVAEQDSIQFPSEIICKINETKFGGRSSRLNNGLQKMCYAIESFMVKMYKNHNVVKSIMEQYSTEHKAVYKMPFVEFTRGE